MRWIRNQNGWAIGFLIALPFVYFWQITLAQGVWLGSDIVRTYYPLGVELSRALSQGRIPLWTPGMYGGFPILADAQIGALYPVNLFLFRFLPAQFAVSYSMLIHLAWAGVGMYLLARFFGLRISSALLAGLVFSFSGFMFSRMEHTTVLTTSAWLPWVVYFQQQFQRSKNLSENLAEAAPMPPSSLGVGAQAATVKTASKCGVWFFLFSISIGMQLLCGFPQVAFMSVLTVGLVGFFGRWLWNDSDMSLRAERSNPQPRLRNEFLLTVFWIALPLVLGAGLVAPQLLPTAELVGYSVRGGTLDYKFITSYSMPLEALTQFVFPFLRGEPSEGFNNEYWAYLGLAPFLLAVLAPFLRRDKRTIFFAIFALLTLSLALGNANPLYNLIYQLPGFNLFRVPARYLLLVVFAGAILAAIGFDELSNRLAPHGNSLRRAIPAVIVFALLTFIAFWLAQFQSMEFWLQVWQTLPILLILSILFLFILVRARRINSITFQSLIVGMTVFDLVCTAPLFTLTLGQITPSANVAVVPRSLAAMELAPGDGRMYTDQYITPSPQAIRASLYPNTSLIYGKESTQAYSSLALARQSDYLFDPSPAMFNLANAKYFTLPLEPRPKTKLLIPYERLALDVLNNEEIFSPTVASGITLVSFTEHAEKLSEGTQVGDLVIRRRDNSVETFPLRIGIETGDWDGARKNIQPAQTQIAHNFAGFWRSFGRAFDGHTYSAHFAIQSNEITGVNVRVNDPSIGLTVERIALTQPDGKEISLASLIGKNDFELTFLSDTAVVWRNLNVLPRAFIVHTTETMNDDRAYERMREPSFPADRVVIVSDGKPLHDDPNIGARDSVQIVRYESERVELAAETNRTGYLFLADTWYPGWTASVDGQPTPIYRADVLFRAIQFEPGTHRIVLEYQPPSFFIGLAVGIISFIGLAGISIFYFRPRR